MAVIFSRKNYGYNPFMNKKFSIIDLETTGSNRIGQKIIEVAIINYDAETDTVEETFSTLINPERTIGHAVTLLTGITNMMSMDAPKFYEIAKKIVMMTEGRIIVGHNVFFDYRFLQREFGDLGYTYRRDVFCTAKSMRLMVPGLESYSLKNLCAHFDINQKRAHRALSDAEDCMALLKISLARMSEEKNGDHTIPAALIDFRFEDYPERPGLYFMYDKNRNLLYVGKSRNIRARLKQHFKQFSGMKREQQLKSKVEKVEYLECYHDLPMGLLELHFIKSARPYFNLLSRRIHFRFGLKLNLDHSESIPGEEIKVTSHLEEISLGYLYGSRRSAQLAKARLYKKAFNLDIDQYDFIERLQGLQKKLGRENYFKKIEEIYHSPVSAFKDRPDIKDANGNWSLQFENNQLKKIWLKNSGDIIINETPDMRWLFLAHLKKSVS